MAAELKSPKELEQQYVTKLVADYPTLSSWFVANEDYSQVFEHYDAACHATMTYNKDKDMDILITAFNWHADFSEDLALEYIHWIISGPFRAFSDKISLEKTKEGKWYIKCTDLAHFPAKVLYNFCVATRTQYEHAVYVKTWKKFIDVGVDPGLAWMMVTNRIDSIDLKTKFDPWTLTVTKTPTYGIGNWNHFFWDVKSSWERIIHGEPIVDMDPKYSYKAMPEACTPTNIIWQGDGLKDYQPLIGKTTKELMEYFGLVKPVVAEVVIKEPKLTPKQQLIKDKLALNPGWGHSPDMGGYYVYDVALVKPFIHEAPPGWKAQLAQVPIPDPLDNVVAQPDEEDFDHIFDNEDDDDDDF